MSKDDRCTKDCDYCKKRNKGCYIYFSDDDDDNEEVDNDTKKTD